MSERPTYEVPAATPGATPNTQWLRVAPALFLLLWSGGFVFLKLGLRHADPLTFLALRYACVVGLLIIPCLLDPPRVPVGHQALAASGHGGPADSGRLFPRSPI
jgi:drug/metabolite transporter (DMT)-like permease